MRFGRNFALALHDRGLAEILLGSGLSEMPVGVERLFGEPSLACVPAQSK